jgi:cell division protein FtsZ
MSFVVTCLGGGTGTGGLPALLDSAKAEGSLTVCVVTLPFSFEGDRKKALADECVREVQDLCDALIVVPNNRLAGFVDKEGAAETFNDVNDVLSRGISSLVGLVKRPGFINVGFADLKRIVEGSDSLCTFGFGEGRGVNKARQAVAGLLEGPLLERGGVVSSAASLLVSIAGGPDLTLKEIGDIMDAIAVKSRKDASTTMGTVIDDSYEGRVVLTVIASEEWGERGLPDLIAMPSSQTNVPRVQVEGSELSGTLPILGVDGADEKKDAKPRKKKAVILQDKLKLDAGGKGRFKNVEPTIMNGEDLDVPTFLRRGIKID